MLPPILLTYNWPPNREFSLSFGRRNSQSGPPHVYNYQTAMLMHGSLSNGRRRSSSTDVRHSGVRVGISSRGVGV
jgi:hypothetical protein